MVDTFTFPFVHRVDLGELGGPADASSALVLLMNVVNFSDGVDGLAAGVCAISAAAFAIIAFDLGRDTAGILAAITCGAALGFLSTTSTRRRSSWATAGRTCSACCSAR